MLSTICSGLRRAAVFSLVLLSFPLAAQAHTSGGYSHDAATKTSNSQWMTALRGSILLSELSIPGTHDTMAFYGGDIAQTQTMSLADQLKSGIRVIDIRCRQVDNVFAVHHQRVFQHVYFGEVLDTVKTFLLNNPGETVLVKVKPEYNAVDNTETFEQTFQRHYWEPHPEWFWDAPHNPTNNPKLDDMRGKIVILQDFYAARYGIDYNNDKLKEQNDYEMRNNWEQYDKWRKVKDQLANANDGDPTVTYVNYLSGAGGSFPYFVASGHSSPGTSDARLATGKTTPGWNGWKDFPRVNCAMKICTIAFEGTNVLTYERVGKDYAKRVGIIMADFPGGGLIDRVIALNDCFKTTSNCSQKAKPFIRK